MPADRKPNPLVAAALTTAGLVVAATRRPQKAAAAQRHRGGDSDTGGRGGTGGQADARNAGRMADTPSEIPARGWWAILKRIFNQVSEDRVLTEAAGITFYSLLAFAPALAALISIYGLFADPAEVERHLEGLQGVVPSGGMEILHDQVSRIAAQGSGTLGLSLLISLGISLWSANQAMKALVDALNVVYEEKETRSFIRYTLVTLGFTLASILFILIAMAGVVVLPVVLGFLGLGDTADLVLRLARWPLLLLVLGLFLAFIYRYGPNRTKARWRWVSWGSAFASIVWVAGSIAFSWYVANFGSYNETYGSLGAVVGFMTWIWISAIVVLVGAELNAEMEHQTRRDTTRPPEKPMGSRGARMADTVAS